jgi:DNA-nicking Smr family endonuclease
VTSSGSPTDKRRHRRLTRDELELWRQVTRSVARLARAPAKAAVQLAAPAAAPAEPAQPQRQPLRPALPGYTPPENQSPPRPALAPLDWRLRKKLARGRASVDDVIDLHGLRQDEAHRALRGFLAAAQSRDAKVVLVVTGKGLSSTTFGSWPERTGGVLYRSVPQWLSSTEFRRIVVGFEEADAAHGGSGALYVRLRRGDRSARQDFCDGR